MEATGEGKSAAEQLVVLIRLSRLDKDRDTNQRLIDKSAEVIASREGELNTQRARLQQAQDTLKRARADVDQAELDLRDRADKVSKFELQLNTAKSNQEYQALQLQIRRLKEEVAAEEDAGLALYERIEKLEDQVKAEEKRCAEKQAEFDDFVTVYKRDEGAARDEIAQTEGRRAALLSELTTDLRNTYETLRRARDGQPIVPVDSRSCSGCGMSLTPNTMARIRAQSVIVTCDSCQRILYEPDAVKAVD